MSLSDVLHCEKGILVPCGPLPDTKIRQQHRCRERLFDTHVVLDGGYALDAAGQFDGTVGGGLV